MKIRDFKRDQPDRQMGHFDQSTSRATQRRLSRPNVSSKFNDDAARSCYAALLPSPTICTVVIQERIVVFAEIRVIQSVEKYDLSCPTCSPPSCIKSGSGNTASLIIVTCLIVLSPSEKKFPNWEKFPNKEVGASC